MNRFRVSRNDFCYLTLSRFVIAVLFGKDTTELLSTGYSADEHAFKQSL